MEHLLHALERGRLGRRGLRVLAGHQHMHVRAELACGGQRLAGGVLQGLIVVLGDEEDGHRQITPASFFSLSTSSAIDFTRWPACRCGGSVVLSTLRRGATSTP